MTLLLLLLSPLLVAAAVGDADELASLQPSRPCALGAGASSFEPADPFGYVYPWQRQPQQQPMDYWMTDWLPPTPYEWPASASASEWPCLRRFSDVAGPASAWAGSSLRAVLPHSAGITSQHSSSLFVATPTHVHSLQLSLSGSQQRTVSELRRWTVHGTLALAHSV